METRFLDKLVNNCYDLIYQISSTFEEKDAQYGHEIVTVEALCKKDGSWWRVKMHETTTNNPHKHTTQDLHTDNEIRLDEGAAYLLKRTTTKRLDDKAYMLKKARRDEDYKKLVVVRDKISQYVDPEVKPCRFCSQRKVIKHNGKTGTPFWGCQKGCSDTDNAKKEYKDLERQQSLLLERIKNSLKAPTLMADIE